MIELDDVTKRFGRRLAVDRLSLRVDSGDIYGLLGHNGAGKSTAIGMMLGQVWPSAGRVRVCGHDVHAQRAKALLSVGAIFESPVFYDYLTARRNLQILSHYTGPTPASRIQEVLDWVGLTGREQSAVKTYSHGMRARLALAQALLPHPQLLILDEPADGLDPEGVHELRHTLLRLNRELGLTLLLSSHLLGEVEHVCNRIAVLNRGRLVHEGSLAEVRSRTAWVRLRTDDFAAAARRLLDAGLIRECRDQELVLPAAGVSSSQITRHLVLADHPVHEITPATQTLESFYLGLFKPAP